MTEQQNTGRRQFLMLGLFFLGPLVLAFIIYYGFDWRPAGSTEHGELLSPPVVLTDADLGDERGGEVPKFRRKWSLIVLMDDGCDETCQAVLYETRQVRKALSRERDRTQRVMLISGEFDRATVELQHPDLIILTSDDPVAREIEASLAGLEREFIYLVDPLGNLMMRFPRDTTMKEIHTDLKKLLKLSRIG
jgi:cytochrome oxidase Cu insertion factor (SCO1/SenC/PrrC family)